jgi:hypothetical protein
MKVICQLGMKMTNIRNGKQCTYSIGLHVPPYWYSRCITLVQVKHRQGPRNVYNMYLTTTTTPQWQHADGSTRQATGTDHHCLGTCPNPAQLSLYPPQRRTRVAGWTTVPLPHEPPHRNWTAALQSLLQGPKHVIVTRGWSRTPKPKRRRVSRVAWAACGRVLSWSISTPRARFPVTLSQLLAL